MWNASTVEPSLSGLFAIQTRVLPLLSPLISDKQVLIHLVWPYFNNMTKENTVRDRR